MALSTPSSPSEIEKDMKTDFQRELVGSNPFLPNSWISALISGFSNRLFDNYITLNQAVEVSFYDTSPEIYLERQADWYGVTRFDATQASGKIIVTGILSTVVPASTTFVSSGGISCVSDADATITAKSEVPSSIVSSGTVATCTMASAHELSPNVPVTISGANETDYNGTFEINIVDDLTFTFTILNATTSPATGTILVAYESAILNTITDEFSSASNLDSSSPVTLSGSISGVDTDAFVYADGFAGGSDKEDIETFRNRFLERVRNPVANFNVASIETKAREVSGVTRVFVQEVTPAIGQVTIFFTRDNDADIIPDSAEALAVKTKILEIKPANTSDDDVIVNPLTGVSTNFSFGGVVPNTATMKTALENSLEEFFKTIPVPETDVTADQYRTAIQNTVDLETGERISTFVLVSPTSDISITTGELATLGTVST